MLDASLVCEHDVEESEEGPGLMRHTDRSSELTMRHVLAPPSICTSSMPVLINNGTVARGTLLVTMARVVLGILGVRPPTEPWALGKLGDWLRWTLKYQYMEPRSKLMRHNTHR